MGKSPAFQFYVKDWLTDPQLRMATHKSKGIWIDLLAYMWCAPSRGEITGTEDQIVKMIGINNGDFQEFISEVKTLKFADVTFCNKNVTIRNRRMYREQKERENTRKRVRKYRNKKASNAECNGSVTPLSPTPSPTPNINTSSAGADPSLKKLSDQLYFDKVFVGAPKFVNRMLALKKNKNAIAHTLSQMIRHGPFESDNHAWAYGCKIMGVENGNFNEADYISRIQKQKKELEEWEKKTK